MTGRQQHRGRIYRSRTADQIGWFQPHAAPSLLLIGERAGTEASLVEIEIHLGPPGQRRNLFTAIAREPDHA